MLKTVTYPHIDLYWPYLLTFAVLESLAVTLFILRKHPGAGYLCVIQGAKALWVLGQVMLSLSATTTHKLFWLYAIQLGYILPIFCWFEFLLEFGKLRKKVPKFLRFAVRGLGLGLLLMILLDWRFDIYWRAKDLVGPDIKLTWGFGAPAVAISAYVVSLICMGVSIWWIWRSQGFLRRQAIAISILPIFHLGGYTLTYFKNFPPFASHLLGVLVGGIYITWLFYRWRVFNIVPLAHKAVRQKMIDGLLVVDENGYIVEMNNAASELFADRQLRIGSNLAELAAQWPELVSAVNSFTDRQFEISRSFPAGVRHFRVQLTPLLAQGHQLQGQVLFLQEITHQKRDQERLLEQEKALSVLSERNRLGRELHDTTGQFPGYVKTQAQAIGLLLKRDRSAEAIGQLEQLTSAAAMAFDEARESITDLSVKGANWNFFARLADWLDHFQQISGIEVTYTGPQQPQRWIAQYAEVHLLRILQEALTNARKHASASQVAITLSVDDEHLTLNIADDGRGFDFAAEKRESVRYGLAGIRERAAEMGGNCTIESSLESGTRMLIVVPLALEVMGTAGESRCA